MKSPEQIFLEVLKELGFEYHKPSEMSNSDYYMVTMESMKKFGKECVQECISQTDIQDSNWHPTITQEDLIKIRESI